MNGLQIMTEPLPLPADDVSKEVGGIWAEQIQPIMKIKESCLYGVIWRMDES